MESMSRLHNNVLNPAATAFHLIRTLWHALSQSRDCEFFYSKRFVIVYSKKENKPHVMIVYAGDHTHLIETCAQILCTRHNDNRKQQTHFGHSSTISARFFCRSGASTKRMPFACSALFPGANTGCTPESLFLLGAVNSQSKSVTYSSRSAVTGSTCDAWYAGA
jgi:hypothetical protein